MDELIETNSGNDNKDDYNLNDEYANNFDAMMDRGENDMN